MPDAKSKYNEDASNGVLGTDLLGMRDRRAYSIVIRVHVFLGCIKLHAEELR